MPREFTYLDFAASAPLRAEAVSALEAYRALPCAVANPNSLHTLGREAARHLEAARRDMARCLGSGFRPQDVSFTGGGTEADNLGVIGLAEGMRARDRKRSRVVLSAIEHDAVLDLARPLKERGFAVDLVAPGRDGVVDPARLAGLLGPDVALVAVMAANNETGAVQPLAAVARAAKAAGASVFADAIQAFGRVPLALSDVDGVALAGHKIGAPVGTACLAVRSRSPYLPQAFGGGQEAGRRPGTQDVAGALALAAVSKLCCERMAAVRSLVSERAQRLYDRVCAEGTGIEATVPMLGQEERLPGVVSLLVHGVDSETLVLALDARGFEVSAGSACSSGSLDPSHVLTAMGVPRDLAFGSLRVSFDERVGQEDLDRFAEALLEVVAERRGSR